MLFLQAKLQKLAYIIATIKGIIFKGVSPKINNKAVFEEFIKTQVKVLSLLEYLL